MDTNLNRFKMIALRTMAGDVLKNDVNDPTLIFRGFDDVLHVCGFVGRKSALCRTLGL